jgi:hypothetical protein
MAYNANNTIFVGSEAGPNVSTPASNYFKGIISNVFIANKGERLEFASKDTQVLNDIDYYPVWRLNTYTVNWKNYDGTILETDYNIPYRTSTSYNSLTPTKIYDSSYHYTFKEWTPAVDIILSDTNYTATFNSIGHIYNITTPVAPKCEETGIMHYDCKDCDYNYNVILSATGHNWN